MAARAARRVSSGVTRIGALIGHARDGDDFLICRDGKDLHTTGTARAEADPSTGVRIDGQWKWQA